MSIRYRIVHLLQEHSLQYGKNHDGWLGSLMDAGFLVHFPEPDRPKDDGVTWVECEISRGREMYIGYDDFLALKILTLGGIPK